MTPTLRVGSVVAAFLLSVSSASAQSSDAPIKGDPARGKSLYANTYRCYACHGYTGETTAPGAPRLVPLARSQEAFIAYLRKPSTPGMPAYLQVPAQQLADLHAYLRSLKPTAPPVESVPLLKALLDRVKQR